MKYPIQILLAFTACILSGAIGRLYAEKKTLDRASEVLRDKTVIRNTDLIYTVTGEKP